MALSFEDSLKAAQAEAQAREKAEVEAIASAAIASIKAPAVMSLESYDIATTDYGVATADESGMIAAYSGDDGSWIQVSNQGYDFYDEYSDEGISTIDDNKYIKLNPKQFNITQETNSQYIPFEMPRYYDGYDLTQAKLQIHFVNSRGHGGIDYPANVYCNNEKIRFGWLVDSRATQIDGKLEFEIQAIGKNSKNEDYIWKSRAAKDLEVIKSLTSTAYIEPDSSWQDSFMARIEGQVVIAQNQAAIAQAAATEATAQAQAAAASAQEAKDEVASLKDGIDVEVAEAVNATVGDVVDDKIADVLLDYYTITETDAKIQEVVDAIPEVDLTGYATETYVQDAIAEDITGKLGNYYTKDEVDTAIENVDVSEQLGDLGTTEDGTPLTVVQYVDNKVADVDVSDQLTNYYTKTEVDTKTSSLSSSISTNETSISSLNSAVSTINQELASIDKSPRVTYDATYGDVELDDGSTAEYMFTLWKTENGVREVQDRFQIAGGGGSGSSVVLRIAYVEGYTTPLVATVSDSVIIKYDFSGEDSAGDTNLDGTASWKVGNRVVATEDVSTGECEFDLTEYVGIGDNKVVLTITHATGAVATKAWTVKVVDVRLESSFDDTKVNIAGQPVNFAFTPYGGVNKTVHFILDGKEIATKASSAAAAGLSDSYAIPAQEHGTHLFEIYMTAEINGKTIESNHIVNDIIWYDESSDAPIIGTVYQKFTARQYETTSITYTVYDPSTETPSVTLKSTYVNEDGETVEEYNSNITMSSNTATWQYKTDVIGEHILTITCGDTVKTMIVTIIELGINISPITSGLVFDFNPIGYSNDDENRLWSNGDIAMAVSDNFDWVNGGYQIDKIEGNPDDESDDKYYQCFCIKAGTSAEINYELFGDDAKINGKQFKLIFKTKNVSNADATFLSCVSDPTGTGKIGIEMKSQEANIYAKTESLPLPYAEDEIIEFEFNISASSEVPSMVMGYEDGVSTRPLVYDDTHDFQQQIGHRKTISLGSPDCDLYIYRFKVYNTSLSDRDILNNFIADALSADEMIDRYDRNQIYKEGILDPDYLAEMCPDLRIIKLEVPHFTADKDDKVYDTNIPSIVECIYKNGDPIYDNWVAYDVVHSGQGTSSNNYGASGRNLDIIMKPYKDYGNAPYIILGDGSQVSKVSLTRESIPVNYFNVKVNIASSENANNALFAKRYNQYNPYTRPFVREDESIIPYIKSTMEFQNAVIFIKESDPDLSTHVEFADNEWHFYAIGNIGDSKKTDDTRLTDQDDKYECILEVMDNTLPLSNMPTGKVGENGKPVYPINPSEWVAGNSAYDALYGETFDEAKGSDKENGLDDTYGWRYVYEDGNDEENAEAKAYVEAKWREFYEFVITSTDEEFKAHLGDYIVLDSLMYYYLFTLRYMMTDNHSKNSFYHYGKTGEVDVEGNPIRKFDMCFGYDFDTSLGIDNYGRMAYRYGYEEIDYVDGTQDWVWNCPNHVLFLRLRELFDDELCELYKELESLGAWSATSLINQFNDWQAQFPEELWRVDIERKYIRTYTKSFINGAAKPEFLKERANGRKKTQRAQFEKNQEKYMSSKFGGTVASSDDVVLRCSVPHTELVVPKSFDMHLTPYSHVYLNVKYNTAPPVKIRAVPNVEYTIEYTADEADIIEIYSASCLKSIGDLSAAYLINGDFSNATKIRELILGSDIEGYNNTNAMTLGLGSNELLNKLDIQNMSGLTSSLDLSGLKNLEELYAFGSNVSGVIFADGGNIEIAEIPSVGTLQMKNLNYLTDDGFDATSYDSLTKLVADNSLLDLVALINDSPNLYQVRLTGINWTLEDSTLLERLYGLAGVTNTGANTDQSVLSGYVHVPVIRQQQLYEYQQAWPDLEIVASTTIEQFAVTFVNDDDSVLEVQYVDKGSYAVDPVKRQDNPIPTPTKESTVSTDYTYAGWNTDLSKLQIFGTATVKAIYSESIRSYTIKYVSMNNVVLQESTGEYGSNVVYDGDIPTYTAEEGGYKYYLFNKWDKSGFIDGDKTVFAVFDSFIYNPNISGMVENSTDIDNNGSHTEGSFAGKNLIDLYPVHIYALTKLSAVSIDTANNIISIDRFTIEDGDDFSFTMGYDVNYEDIESEEIISEKMVFNGSNHYDTGIQLFDTDKDFTLAIDYEMLSSTSGVLAQCFRSNGSRGFRLQYNNGVKVTWGTASTGLSATSGNTLLNNREMVVIRHIAGDNNLYVYGSDLNNNSSYSTIIERAIETNGISSTLVFGASKADDGLFESYYNGNVYWAKIWYKDLGDDACTKLACWTHEKITMEACGVKKYYLTGADDSRCLLTLLASHLLKNEKKWSSSQNNSGGWATSTLNKFLNDRFYNAMPNQVKSLVKQVTVASSIGGMSTETSTSECYVYLPSARELFESYKDTPQYSGESSYTISYMSEEENARKRAFDGGDYHTYYTRSPYYNSATYVERVNENGESYPWQQPNIADGVLIEFCF